MSFFNFKKILGGRQTALGIDIGSSSIKVVELKKEGGKAVLKAYGEIALGPYAGGGIGTVPSLTNDKISEALRDVLHESNIKTTESGVAIPFKSSLVSLIEMPALSEKKLEEIIPIEARKYIPVPISEVTLDWWIIPKEKYDHAAEVKEAHAIDKTEVLVISIHNEILNSYNNIVRDNGLQTSFFEIEMFSVVRSIVARTNTPVLVFDFGALGTKLYIVVRGIIRASHIINKGSKDITEGLAKSLVINFAEAEKIKRNITSLKEADQKTVNGVVDLTLNHIWAETRTIISNFERTSGVRVGLAILSGGGIALPHFVERVEKELNLKAELGNPFSKISAPAFISATLRDTAYGFAVATGAALRKLEELS